MKNAILTFLILAITTTIAATLILKRPAPEIKTPERPTTGVEVIQVQPQTVKLRVKSQGTVLPKTESNLAIEVSGRIIEVSDNFRPGAVIRKGDVLLKIDPADDQAAVAARAAELASAELSLARERALADQAQADWDALGKGEPSDLTLRKPQLKQAKALVTSACANLERAKRDLSRCHVTAPYDGRVLSKSVDLGQYVAASPTGAAARIYSTASAEIRLPISEREANYLNNPETTPAKVQLSSANRSWTARLVRLEGTIDTSSRLLYAIAAINDPFSGPEALRRGLFVNADIEGRMLHNVYSIPRYALRGSNSVYVLSPENRLEERKVEIIKSDTETVIIKSGLQPGERIATSPIAYYVENMPAEVINKPYDIKSTVSTPAANDVKPKVNLQ